MKKLVLAVFFLLVPVCGWAQTCSSTDLGGGFTCVQIKHTYPVSAGVTLDSSPTANNLLAVAYSWNDISSTPTMSSSGAGCAGNSWTALDKQSDDVGSLRVYYSVVAATGACTVTPSGFPSDAGISVFEISGAATADVLRTSVSNANPTGSGVALTSASFTPTAGDLIFQAWESESEYPAGGITAGSGFTLIGLDSGHFDAQQAKGNASAGAQTASFTAAASTHWSITVAVFKPSGGGAAAPIRHRVIQ